MGTAETERNEFAQKAYKALSDFARKTTDGWGFLEWYADGIDWYLARDVLFVALQWSEDVGADIGDPEFSIHDYSPEEIAEAAYEYARSMDDFTRLWNSDEGKRQVLRDYAEELDLQRSKNEKDAKIPTGEARAD